MYFIKIIQKIFWNNFSFIYFCLFTHEISHFNQEAKRLEKVRLFFLLICVLSSYVFSSYIRDSHIGKFNIISFQKKIYIVCCYILKSDHITELYRREYYNFPIGIFPEFIVFIKKATTKKKSKCNSRYCQF